MQKQKTRDHNESQYRGKRNEPASAGGEDLARISLATVARPPFADGLGG
jgi:hypothetical protein